MKPKDLVWAKGHEHFNLNRTGRSRRRHQGDTRPGNRSQHLYGHGMCWGYAIQFIDGREPEYGFMRYGELGQDELSQVSKLELAALVADLVGSVP